MNDMFCCVPVSPLRSEPSHRSEMISQQLFGELCTVLDDGDRDCSRIRCEYDGYEGWVQKSHLAPIKNEKAFSLQPMMTASWINEIEYNGQKMMIPLGSVIQDEDMLRKGELWKAKGTEITKELIQQLAFPYLNTAYLWGGRSVFGIDCSGFVQMVYKFLGVALPRDSSVQAREGELVNFVQEGKCGDLAFFDNEEGRINHVGLLLNDHHIIHASGKVRIDKIDQQGIINTESGQRTHTLRIIKRFY